ncbi:MAG: hypothetical protein H6730_37095 [Deltaproteobacteria bacterium]|nr:hypothetical protein [Deltaproteobacteria bacterium]
MTLFGRPTISRGQARMRLERSEWPGMLPLGRDLHLELAWVPFDQSGRVLSQAPAFQGLQRPTGPAGPAPPHLEGSVVPSDRPADLYWPYWTARLGPDGYAIVDARDGGVVALDAHVSPAMSRLRLGFFVGMAVYIAWMAAFLLNQLVLISGFVGRMVFDTSSMVFVAAMVALAAYFSTRIYQIVHPGLAEPLQRVVHQRIQWGIVAATRRFLERAGFLIFLMTSLGLLLACLNLLARPVDVLLAISLGQAACGYLFFRSARSLARREQVTQDALPPVPDTHPTAVAVQIVLWTAVVASMVVGLWEALAELGIANQWPQLIGRPDWPQANAVEVHLVVLAGMAVLALVRGLDPMSRWVLVAGLGSGHIAEVFFGDLGEAGVPLITVAMVAFGLAAKEKGPGREAALESLRLTWRFNIAAAVGRLMGRLVGGVLLGTSGIILGEFLGETILAILGVETPEEAPRPMPSTRVARIHQAAIAGVVVLGTWLTVSLTDPRSLLNTKTFSLPAYPERTGEMTLLETTGEGYKIFRHGYLAAGSCEPMRAWYASRLRELAIHEKTAQRVVYRNGNAAGALRAVDATKPAIEVKIWDNSAAGVCMVEAYWTVPVDAQ